MTKEVEVHDANLIRSLVYDMGLPDPEIILARIGLPPVSEEGRIMETQACDRRLARINGAMPFLFRQANICATILANEHALMSDEQVTEERLLPVMAAYQAVSLASIVASLSYLLELGVLKFSEDDQEESDE